MASVCGAITLIFIALIFSGGIGITQAPGLVPGVAPTEWLQASLRGSISFIFSRAALALRRPLGQARSR
jgi:hypothetical protein